MKSILVILIFPLIAKAVPNYSIGVYDSETDKDKATIVLTCNKRVFKLLLEKDQLESNYKQVEAWALDMRKNCEGEN